MKSFIIWNNLAMLPMVLDLRAAQFFNCTEMESKQKEGDELQQTSSEPSCTSNPRGGAEHFSGHCNLLYVRGIKSEFKKKITQETVMIYCCPHNQRCLLTVKVFTTVEGVFIQDLRWRKNALLLYNISHIINICLTKPA